MLVARLRDVAGVLRVGYEAAPALGSLVSLGRGLLPVTIDVEYVPRALDGVRNVEQLSGVVDRDSSQ
jgi:hypothetical protein